MITKNVIKAKYFSKKSQYIMANTTLKEQKNRIDINSSSCTGKVGPEIFPR